MESKTLKEKDIKKDIKNEIKNEINEEERLNEFRDLAKSIKSRIYELMIMGNNHEAAVIIEQLQSVTPYDEDLEELKRKIGLE